MHKQSKIRNSYPLWHQQVFITCRKQGSFTCSGFYTEDKCHHSKCPCSPAICGMGYLFGQLGSAVLAVSPPSLLTGTVVLEAGRTLALCNHCSATAKTSVCFQCWFANKSWAYVHIKYTLSKPKSVQVIPTNPHPIPNSIVFICSGPMLPIHPYYPHHLDTTSCLLTYAQILRVWTTLVKCPQMFTELIQSMTWSSICSGCHWGGWRRGVLWGVTGCKSQLRSGHSCTCTALCDPCVPLVEVGPSIGIPVA